MTAFGPDWPIHSSFTFSSGNKKKPVTTLPTEVQEDLTGDLTLQNWEKIEACCFGEFSNLDRDQSIGNLRRLFRVVKEPEGRSGLIVAEIQRRQNEGGDPIAAAENVANINSDDSDYVNFRGVVPENLRPLDSASQGGLLQDGSNGIEPRAPHLHPRPEPTPSTLLSFNLPAAMGQREARGEVLPDHKKVYFTASPAQASHTYDSHLETMLIGMMASANTLDEKMKVFEKLESLRTARHLSDRATEVERLKAWEPFITAPATTIDAINRGIAMQCRPDLTQHMICQKRTRDGYTKPQITVEFVAWAKNNLSLSYGPEKKRSTPIVVQILPLTGESAVLYAIDRIVYRLHKNPQLEGFGIEEHGKRLTFVEGGPEKVMYSRIPLSKDCMEKLISLAKENPGATSLPWEPEVVISSVDVPATASLEIDWNKASKTSGVKANAVALRFKMKGNAKLEIANANARALWSYAKSQEMAINSDGILTMQSTKYDEMLCIPAYTDIIKLNVTPTNDMVRSILTRMLPFRPPAQGDIAGLYEYAFEFRERIQKVPEGTLERPVWIEAVGTNPNAFCVRLFALSETGMQTIWKEDEFLKLAVFSNVLSDFLGCNTFNRLRERVKLVGPILRRKLVHIGADHVTSSLFSSGAFKDISRAFALALVIENLEPQSSKTIKELVQNHL
jgi:hypothetical protein